MKISLSRKGMDSSTGAMPSPILPDGTLLSLPIPVKDELRYADIGYQGQSFADIIAQLNPKFDFDKNGRCHLDPDIRKDIEGRPFSWKPAFGQSGLAATHLDKMEVEVGDLFLFFGYFKQAEYDKDMKLRFVKNAPDLHIIYGYMEVGEIVRDPKGIREEYHWHPHARIDTERNRLYIPSEKLSLDPGLPGYGSLRYKEELVLTKPEQPNRSLWRLPRFFADEGIAISWQNGKPERVDEYAELNSSGRGQEFVVNSASESLEKDLKDWVLRLIQPPRFDLDHYLRKGMINHLVYVLPENGAIYCRKNHRIQRFDREDCLTCCLWSGSLQGEGVECYYLDIVPRDFTLDHHEEAMRRTSELIEAGLIDRIPVTAR